MARDMARDMAQQLTSIAIFFFWVGNICPAQNPSSAQERMASWQLHQQLAKDSPFNELVWKPIGPRFQGGRIESVAVPGGASSTIYAGVGSGNLWKSQNHGTTWVPIFEDQPAFAIGSVAVAPTDPATVWVGTGEVLMARSSFAGAGVFKSKDGGGTWEHMGLVDTHHIARVLIDPVDPDTVYVAAIGRQYSFNEERGLFKTTDGGETWKKVLYVSDRVGVVEVVMDPRDRETLYAVAWERDRKAWNNVENGPGSGVYKTTDGGVTWERLSNGFPGGEHIGRIGLAIAPSNPDVVYAVVDNRTPRAGRRGGGGDIYGSTDGGESWSKTHEQSLPTSIGYDFCLVRVSPDDPEQLWVLGNYLLRSDDGGGSYERLQGTVVNLLPHGTSVMHLDQHEMWIDPENSDHMLLGNDGGLYLSWDRAESWLRLNNLPIAEVYAVTVDDQTPYNVYIGTQDDAALFGLSDQVIADGEPDRWEHVYLDRWGGGDSYFTYRDPSDPDTIYYEHQFGDLRRKNMRTGRADSIRPRGDRGGPELRHNWMTPFFISTFDDQTLYYGAQMVFRSPDRGESWVAISPDLSTQPGPDRQGDVPFGTTTSISESRLSRDLLYVGTDDGNVQVTRDGGGTWAEVGAGLPRKWVSRVVASEHQEGRAYVTFTGYREDDFRTYVFASQDYGATWSPIRANLPDEAVNVIREDPRDEDVLYLGTDLGVYISVDRGSSWQSLGGGLPTAAVHDIAVHRRERQIVIGTHGRSAFVLDVGSILDR